MDQKIIQKLISDGNKLAIIVDMGITETEKINFALSKGMEVIVVDHHLYTDPPPVLFHHSLKKAAVQLCYEVAQAINPDEQFSDLVALGSIADKIELNSENKEVIIKGIERINQKKRMGLKILLSKIKLAKLAKKPGKSWDKLRSYFNFPLRNGLQNNFYQIFVLNDKSKLDKLTDELIKFHQNIYKKIDEFGKKIKLEESKLILVEHHLPRATSGVNGAIAERLANKFNRIALVHGGKDKNGLVRVSARAPSDGYHLVKLFRKCSDLFLNFGGHPKAAGFQARYSDLEKIKECLIKNLH